MYEDAREDLNRERYRLLVGQLRRVTRRLESAERRTRQLENAVSGMSRSVGECSLGPPCANCEQSLLLVSGDEMRCPRCAFRQTR